MDEDDPKYALVSRASLKRMDALWAFHDFWSQIAIAALLHILNYQSRALAEVLPIIPPWENPRWQR